jgi:hypothetical protein
MFSQVDELRTLSLTNQLLHLTSLITRALNRELSKNWTSVSPINPWSDMRETLLPTVLLLLRHCWNAWRHCWNALRHCWRGHMTLPHSCIIQVFKAVAWQRGTCLPQCCIPTVAGRQSQCGRHCFPLLSRNCCVYRGAARANPLQYQTNNTKQTHCKY